MTALLVPCGSLTLAEPHRLGALGPHPLWTALLLAGPAGLACSPLSSLLCVPRVGARSWVLVGLRLTAVRAAVLWGGGLPQAQPPPGHPPPRPPHRLAGSRPPGLLTGSRGSRPPQASSPARRVHPPQASSLAPHRLAGFPPPQASTAAHRVHAPRASSPACGLTPAECVLVSVSFP